jgi:hypothetical protein
MGKIDYVQIMGKWENWKFLTFLKIVVYCWWFNFILYKIFFRYHLNCGIWISGKTYIVYVSDFK